MLLLYRQQNLQTPHGFGGGVPKAFLLDSEPVAKPAPPAPPAPAKPKAKPVASVAPVAPIAIAPSLTRSLIQRYIDQQTRQAQPQPLAQYPQPLALDLSLLAIMPAQDVQDMQALERDQRSRDDALRLLLLLS